MSKKQSRVMGGKASWISLSLLCAAALYWAVAPPRAKTAQHLEAAREVSGRAVQRTTSVALEPKPPVPGAPEGASPTEPSGDQSPPGLTVEAEQTPAWKIAKTTAIADVVGGRVTRLEGEIAELERTGKATEAEERGVLLARLKAQLGAMHEEVATYALAGADTSR